MISFVSAFSARSQPWLSSFIFVTIVSKLARLLNSIDTVKSTVTSISSYCLSKFRPSVLVCPAPLPPTFPLCPSKTIKNNLWDKCLSTHLASGWILADANFYIYEGCSQSKYGTIIVVGIRVGPVNIFTQTYWPILIFVKDMTYITLLIFGILSGTAFRVWKQVRASKLSVLESPRPLLKLYEVVTVCSETVA